MAAADALINVALDSAKERCHTLRRELARIERRTHIAPAATALLSLIASTTDEIELAIDALANDADLRELLPDPGKFTLRVYRHAKFFGLLHQLLGFLQGTDLESVPSSLVAPMRRHLRRCIPQGEVLFTARPELNYTFADVAPDLRAVYEKAGPRFKTLMDTFPKSFIIISFPSPEASNVLLHCIISHEVGHGLFGEAKLDEQILPLIKVDEAAVQQLVDDNVKVLEAQKAKAPTIILPTALQIKQAINKQLQDTVISWVEEISSDALGLCMFGPAYYFSFVQFIVSIQYLDVIGNSHPAPRLRLAVMRRMMEDGNPNERLGHARRFSPALKAIYDEWALPEAEPEHPIYKVAFKAILPHLDRIGAEAIALTTIKNLMFTSEQLAATAELSRMIRSLVPPIELLEGDPPSMKRTDMVSVLNAGWEVHHVGLSDFARSLRLDPVKDLRKAKDALSPMILKWIELLETATTWDEVQIAVERQRNSAPTV